ncbi:hypothetical protein BBAD15_g5854 [Beauveria bassiana D1-5]|uniref:ubiquitinyl hydrolase 1 n=1 Tax=Beauveria bassiana D1-5 TaxID=1245745 RepID=A0A0A2VMI6_BEABA|nr:hypothetical protein BBAD15_g5854 [Beauveria bassiana D1-5]
MPTATGVSVAELQLIIHHVFLTPGNPQSGDDIELALASEVALLNYVCQALRDFGNLEVLNGNGAVQRAREAIQFLRDSKISSGDLDAQKLQKAFETLSKEGGMFPIHVQAQNAAIIASRDKSEILLEFSELAPENEAAMRTKGRLKRHFPGSAVSIPVTTFANSDLHLSMAETVAKMSFQQVKDMKPTIRKSGESHIEERDTTNPTIVTDFLATVLSALGELAQVPVLEKNTREQVSWKSSTMPWRRSSIWLLARITIQTIFDRVAEPHVYKQFMVFFMSLLLEVAVSFNMQSETLYCMVAKLSGRLRKLGENAPNCLLGGVGTTMASAVSCMKASWQTTRQALDKTLSLCDTKAYFPKDIYTPCPGLDSFIQSIDSRKPKPVNRGFSPSWSVPEYNSSTFPKTVFAQEDESAAVELLAFESWIAASLDHWLAANIGSGDTPGKLLQAVKNYHKSALERYSGSPEATSLMLLTIMELWVACDKSACQTHDLLRNFNHEIPGEVLQSLILPFKNDMERLRHIEKYFETRKHRVPQHSPSIFSSFGDENSLAVQFFHLSAEHQALKKRIEDWAEIQREEKRQEFRYKLDSYRSHTKKAGELQHKFFEHVNWRTGYSRQVHDRECKRCYHEKQASNIGIQVHEWPLPCNLSAAQNVVFELQVPQVISAWRDTTAYIVSQVLKSTRRATKENGREDFLSSFLPKYWLPPTLPRFVLASTTKSNSRTHRKLKYLSTASEDDVLVKNGLQFHYFDCHLNKWSISFQQNDRIAEDCTYKLSGPCNSLQQFLFRPHLRPNGKTANHVISEQSMCPEHLSLEEFKAMAALPCGYRVQWLNILTQLHMPTVDFANHDVLLILLQIRGQVGPPDGTVYRAGHRFIIREDFTLACVDGLGGALDKVRENWESYHAVSGYIALTSKLLSFATKAEAPRRCLQFLEECRSVVSSWMTLLQDKVKQSETESTRAEFLDNTLQVAQICIETFDVDEIYLQTILGSVNHAAVLLEASITAHDVSRGVEGRRLISRLRCDRILFKAFRFLKDEIIEKSSPCLDLALQQTWSAYPGGATWKAASPPYGHWMITAIPAAETNLLLHIQFNLLTGELLVNGNPLSRLPAQYEQHSMYADLFGKTTLEVLPADFPGMSLSSKKSYHGYTLFFGMTDQASPDLLLVARSGTQIYDLVPSRVFANNLPHYFANRYIHWYNRSSQTVEFRDKQDPWKPLTSQNWIMTSSEQGWVLERQEQHILLGMESSTVRYLAELLKPVENKDYIHASFDKITEQITVELPRLQLDFFAETGASKLCSRQFRGMYVDSDQGIGTLVGLESKLILRNENNRRKVLIPDGEPTWSRASANHVRVSIPHGTSKKAHAYEVDTRLQRLVDNGSMQSKLAICFLHALTSYCLPDELTGKTGTEQALSILRSASLRSFDHLKDDDILKLTKIARLSPTRQYYPKNLQCMENIEWDTRLSFLSQDNALHSLVKEIFEEARDIKVFYPAESNELPRLDHVNDALGERCSIRAASFQVDGFGGENHTTSQDAVYRSRDTMHHSGLSTKAFQIAKMIVRDGANLVETVDPALVSKLWSSLSSVACGSIGDLSTRDICYDSQWLQDQETLLQKFWCQLHRLLLASSSPLNQFQVMMCLCTMGFSSTAKLQLIQCIAAFFKAPIIFNVEIPSASQYWLTEGYDAKRSEIEAGARAHVVSFDKSPEYDWTRNENETDTEFLERRRIAFECSQKKAVDAFVEHVHQQWISRRPEAPSDNSSHLDSSNSMARVFQVWDKWYQNHLFYQYLLGLKEKLDSLTVVAARPLSELAAGRSVLRPQMQKSLISVRAMFAFSVPSMPRLEQTELDVCQLSTAHVSASPRLPLLLERLRETCSSEHPSQRIYVEELERSLNALKQVQPPQALMIEGKELRDVLANHCHNCQANVDRVRTALETAITKGLQLSLYERPSGLTDEEWQIVATFMAPRTSCSVLLDNLVRGQWDLLSEEWKDSLVMFGVAVTKLQRAERLLQAKSSSDLVKELLNVGHTNWKPKDSPESLLLEIESGILIREVQEHIASEMRSPAAEKNAVMQLNMGEGKSSVIVPIVAAQLADGSKLVRVVVGKPQAKELRRTLISKLSGLLNRRIFQMPFNRSLRLKEIEVKGLYRLYQKCMKQGGVLLVQPEHMLSFKLMAVEYQTMPNQERAGAALVRLHHFFQTNSRDIVDESDENFSPKFELIYTMGEQRPIELNPERWTFLQRLLDVVVDVAPSVRQDMPEGMEISHNRRGRFPRTRILRAEAGAQLLRRITQKICDTGLPGLPIGRQSDKMRQAIYEYILEEDVSMNQVALVEKNDGFFTDSIKGPLLLLRGLIAGRVLSFALRQKRWRVNYGLDPDRTPNTKLAVPYRAKDSPSTRAEFSHPDVVILLTCLSYYYEGLTDEALFSAFAHLMRSDQSETEYEEWVADAPKLPSSFHRLTGVNLKDVGQITREVFPHLRQAKSVVDYYLSHMVFPKEMKEFSHKLSSSGWDLGAQKRHATTGFSGTNDSRHVLPLEVKQLDLEEQLHTNSLVLENLLRPENKVHLLRSSAEIEGTDTELLLEFAASKENEVHVILDVGAQVLELTNIQVAKKWLELLPVKQIQEAVVFFDDDDDICVMDRKGVVERLQTSPYAEQLDRCLVFLDQAHTRGTDLRLPEHYRAAVTLGPDITKDRLVQACMRMRKLGHGQSVVFCVSREMQSRIHMATSKPSDSDVGVDDVLMWAISETHADLRRLMPLWAIQGARFYNQKMTWDNVTTEDGIALSKEQAEAFLEEEAQTIDKRYRPASQTAETDATLSSFANLTLQESEDSPLHSIKNRCDEFGISHFRSAALQEEQEKELAPEIEQERQIERPPVMSPAEHELHEDLKQIVTTGRIEPKSTALRPAFLALETTSVADWVDLSGFPDDLLVTVDYARTVQLRASGASADSFQRPIQWILTGLDPSKAVIISPYEAHHLILQLTKPGSRARLHLYAPRVSLGMQPLDLLRLYTVSGTAHEDWELSRHLRLQLNLFAGQLYFGSYQDYADTCDMLSLAWRPLSADEGHVQVETDGFVVGGNARFTKSPVQSIKVLLSTLRRDCRDISKTHWGRILGGEFLTKADFEA